jgi:hypothetical protein
MMVAEPSPGCGKAAKHVALTNSDPLAGRSGVGEVRGTDLF